VITEKILFCCQNLKMRRKHIELQWQGANDVIEEKRVTEGEKGHE
jgi:hypothetical protein